MVLVLDFDGVLVDSNAIKRQAYFEIFAAVPGASSLVEGALRANPFGTRYDVIGTVLRLQASGPSMAGAPPSAAVAHYAERYNEICEGQAAICREMPEATACLRRLAARYPLYVNSATPEDSLRRVVARRGWSNLFRGVFGSPTTKADNLRRIMRETGTPPGNVLFVGDRDGDQRAARQCGCRFIGMAGPDADFTQAATTVADLGELERFLTTSGW